MFLLVSRIQRRHHGESEIPYKKKGKLRWDAYLVLQSSEHAQKRR